VPRLATDHNFNRWITNGLLRRLPDLDIVRILDAGLAEADDPSILEWAAREGRVLLTHDRKTLIRFANERVARGEPMPGVVEVLRRCPVGRAIDDLMLLLACTADSESADRAHFIPL
jgi:predicted nuclease of predicted toxin-antitoxin system